MKYIALIHKEENTDYGVSFPDFPGCVSAGETLEQVKMLAQEALISHIDILKEMEQEVIYIRKQLKITQYRKMSYAYQ